MRKIGLEELKKRKDAGHYADWLLPWTQEALFHCFSFLVLELLPYDMFYSDGGICLLATGEGMIGQELLRAESVFGIQPAGESIAIYPELYKAREESILLCFNKNITGPTCFGMGCGGMHTRFRDIILQAARIRYPQLAQARSL